MYDLSFNRIFKQVKIDHYIRGFKNSSKFDTRFRVGCDLPLLLPFARYKLLVIECPTSENEGEVGPVNLV